MRLATKDGVAYWERNAFRWFRLRKRVYQFVRYRPGCAKTVALIVGCQRSGTSMLAHLFRLDWDVVTFDEISPLSTEDPEGLRLNKIAGVRNRVLAERSPLIVLKPLVESQHTGELLEAFPRARAIWVFRDFREVTASNLRFFGSGNGFLDLKPILDGDRSNWRSECCSSESIDRIRRLNGHGLTDLESAALFWWARNSLFFELGLDTDSRVMAVDYRDLVKAPSETLHRIYDFIGIRFPGDRLARAVLPARPQSVLGEERLRPEVLSMCEGLLAHLRRNAGCEGEANELPG